MVGTGVGNVYSNSVKNFDRIEGHANGGGTNARANLYDSNGDDYFVAKPGVSAAQNYMVRTGGGTGPSAYIYAGVGFMNVQGYSTAGGNDEAVLNGSDGDEPFRSDQQLRRAYLTRPGGMFIYALDFKKITAYPGLGTNDQAYLIGTSGDDTFTASPTVAQMTGTIPATTTTFLNIAGSVGAQTWEKVFAYSYADATAADASGNDVARVTGTTGDDTFIGIGTPRTTPPALPSGMAAGVGRLTGTGYAIETWKFDQVYADLRTGNRDVATLYDSNGPGTDTFWGNLHDAVLSDGTVDLTNGNLLAAAGYYYRVTGLDNAALDPTKDTVNLIGSTTGGTNNKKTINPLDYVLAVSGPWTDLP